MMVCLKMCEEIIELFNYNVPQRKVGQDLYISPSTVLNITKQGGKPKPDSCDL